MEKTGVVFVHRGEVGKKIADPLTGELIARGIASATTITIKEGFDTGRKQLLNQQFSHYAKCSGIVVLLIVTEELFGPDNSGIPICRPSDFVRQQLEAALQHDVRIIPVLIDQARMPRPDKLPLSLVSLTDLHAFPLRRSSWEFDLSRLGRAIQGVRAVDGFVGIAASAVFPTVVRRASGSTDGRSGALQDKNQITSAVLLAVGAPSRCEQHSQFIARLVVYVDSMRSSALKKLKPNRSESVQVQSDVRPQQAGGWEVGTPFTVVLSGNGFLVESPVKEFSWNGSEDLGKLCTDHIEMCQQA